MKIPGLNIGFDYAGSYFLPKEIVGDFGSDEEDILKLSLCYENPRAMKGQSKDYYLAYHNNDAKRIAFRAMKLQLASLTLVKAHHKLDNVHNDTLFALVKEWSDIFGIPLNGLQSYGMVKDRIVNDILKEVDYNLMPYYQYKLWDIQKHDDYSKVQIYNVRARYNQGRI